MKWPWSKPETQRTYFTSQNLFEALRSQLGFRFADNCTIRLADTGFLSVMPSEAQDFILQVASFYRPEINDCDDHAWMAKCAAIKAQNSLKHPLAFGAIWTTTHAFNWYRTAEGKILLIDQPGASNMHTPITLLLA